MKTRLLIIIPSLKAGGAERVLSFLSKEINKDKFKTLLVVIGSKKDAIYETGDNVVFLDQNRLAFAIPKLLKEIFKYKPKIIVGSIIHVNIFLGALKLFFPKYKVIVREASVISMMNNFIRNSLIFDRRFVRFFYKKVDKIVCQSYDMHSDFQHYYGIDSKRLIVINNPITQLKSSLNLLEPVPGLPIRFVTVGRLSEEKGHQRILNALAQIKEFEFEYTIIGDGPLKDQLFKQIADLGLTDRVKHIVQTYDIPSELSRHHLFLQGSYVEGFPNSVLESCFSGTPVLAYPAPGGTNEIIQDAVNGYIAKDDNEYMEILTHPENYLSLDRVKIVKSVESRFSPEKILLQYESLFDEV